MPGSTIIYQAKQEIFGKHLRAKEWIEYSGKLTVYDRKTNSVLIKIKSEIANSLSEAYSKVTEKCLRAIIN